MMRPESPLMTRTAGSFSARRRRMSLAPLNSYKVISRATPV